MLRQLPPDWNAQIQNAPLAHALQSAEWGLFKQRTTGWQPETLRTEHGAALLLTRRVGPLRVMYLPKGPLIDPEQPEAYRAFLQALMKIARSRGVIWLKIDPDIALGYGVPGTADDQPDPAGVAFRDQLVKAGWRYSESQVQYRHTLVIDLTQSEETILKKMSQSTRYKVRYGPKHGVTVRPGTLDDLPLLYNLYHETGTRDGFLTRPYAYYADEWGALITAEIAHPLIAEYEGVALAHVILFRLGKTCWYFYGASSDQHRNLMPTYLLQWEAMRWAKSVGCTRYDFWGAPDHFEESDPMWGVYRWKEGFGGVVTRWIGAWDYVPYPPLYALYEQLMPRVLDTLKRLRRARIG
jgi:lipid II:glycine glycyltransferase (peptidoglycan interpeptide bridge formation enzyme)